MNDCLVRVRGQWSSLDRGDVPAARLRDLHWRIAGGSYATPDGVGFVSLRQFLQARIWCDSLVAGSVGHACIDTPPPHEIIVFIIEWDNPNTFDDLLDRANS